MGYQDRDYAAKPHQIHMRAQVVLWIIGVTVAAYFVQGLLEGRAGIDLARIFGVVPERLVGSLWIWQFFTHVLLHETHGITHLAFNMLFLYWVGTDVAEIYGTRRFLTLYFGGAALCATAYTVAAYATGHADNVAIGASGAIMAVAVIGAFYYPSRQILVMWVVPAPLWLVVAGYVGLDLYYPLAGLRPWVSSAGHLGGALFGLLFCNARGFSFRLPQVSFVPAPSRLDVNRILDKITSEGMESLTDAERRTLKRASKRAV